MVGLWCIQTILTIAEVAGAYLFVSIMLHERVLGFRKWSLMVGQGILMCLTIYQRTYSMYSRIWLVLTILYCCIMVMLCYKEKRVFICVAYAVYFETLYCLDLFLYIGIAITFLNKNFLVSQFQIGMERIVVYLITRSIMAVFIITSLYKKKYYFKRGKFVWIIVLASEHLGLIFCDNVFISGWEEQAIGSWVAVLLFYPFVLLGLVFYFMKQKYKLMYEQIRIQNILYCDRYEVIEKKSKEKDQIYHDYKNHLIILQRLIFCSDITQAQSYLNGLLQCEEECERRIGHPVLDYLLQMKILDAKKRNVQVKEGYECNMVQMNEEQLRDWSVLLGNLWDNAIEGCEGVGEKKDISFLVKQTGNMVIVKIENSCCSNVTPKRLKTTKADTKRHGIGLQNIEFVVEKHEGTIERSCRDGIFTTRVIMIK